MQSQTAHILAHLQAGHYITPIDALEQYGCFRLGARIWDLRQKGYPIKTTITTRGGKNFARYRLVESQAAA